MTPTDIVNAVAALERTVKSRLEGYSFVTITAWRDGWRLVIHTADGQHDFFADQLWPDEAFSAAHKWLDDYKPDEQRLAEILGLHLLKSEAA
jgi:DNA polymerase IIIc chi subunit